MEPLEASWDEALELLGEILESRQCPPRHLVVCGGAALRAAGIVSRVTRDVDVLAQRGEVDGDLATAWPLPDDLKQAVADVAVELKLPEDWLNASTSMLVGPLEDLPSEVWQEMGERSYGSCLRISYLSRIGLIHLKMQAAVQRSEQRDLEDLRALSPTKNECLRAGQWMERIASLDEARRDRLANLLKELGHD